jgi:hypothetical protein
MTTPRFDPLNALETLLLAVQNGEQSTDVLLAQLLEAQVFLLLDRDPGPEEARADSAAPLLLNNPQGQPVLAVFTAPERAISMTLAFPQYAHGVTVGFRALLGFVRPGLGLVVNPGAVAGFELPAATVTRLQAEALQ